MSVIAKVDDEERKEWRINLTNLFRGPDAPTYDRLLTLYKDVIRRRDYLKKVTDDEMDDLFSLAVHHNNHLVFEIDYIDRIYRYRGRPCSLPQTIQKIQECCDRFNPPLSFIAHLTRFFQLDREDTCKVLSRSFIERIVAVPPQLLTTTPFNFPLLNRAVECGVDVANRVLTAMIQSERSSKSVGYLAWAMLRSETTEATMDFLWNRFVAERTESNRVIQLYVNLSSPPRHVAKIIGRLVRGDDPNVADITLNFVFVLLPSYLFDLLVAGVTIEQLGRKCIIGPTSISGGIPSGIPSGKLRESEESYRVVSTYLTGRVGKDLTWLIFQYLV